MANLNFGVRFRAYTQQFVQKVKGTGTAVRDAYQDMQQQAREARDRMSQDFDRTAKSGDTLATTIKSIRNQIVGMATAAVGLYSVQRGLAAIVSTGAQFETLRTQLNSVMGSIEAGEQATAWVKDFTKTTPFDLAKVTDGFIKLKAFGLDPMDGTYQAIADQASKLGGSQETLTGITLALGQAWAKQKLQGEEILQLVERGVPVWELLEKATGKNTQQLQALSEAGKLGRKEIKALIEEIGKSAEGAAADQIKTWNGMMSNLKDQWADFLNTIAEAGVLDYLKEQITALNQAVADLGEDGLREYAKNIADAIIGTAEALKTGAQAIWDYRYALGALVGAIAAVKLARLVKEINDYSTVVIDAAKETRAWAAAQQMLNGTTGGLIGRVASLAGVILTRFNIAVAVAALGTKQLADAWRESEMAAARETIALSEKAGQYAKIAAGQAKYAGTYIKTAEDLERADQAGLDAYEARLKGAQKYYQALLDEAKVAREAGQDADEQGKYAAERLADIEAAMVSLKAAQDAATNNAPALTEAAQEVINQFDLMRAKGDSVKEALDKAFGAINIESVADIQAIGEAINELQTYAKATGDQIDTALTERLKKLSMEELKTFRKQARMAFSGSAEDAATLGRVLDSSMDAALSKLGVDLEKLKSGMTAAGAEAVDAFSIVQDELKRTGATGKDAADVTQAAFENAFNKVSTTKGFERLRDAVKAAFREKRMAADDYREALELIEAGYQKAKDASDKSTSGQLENLQKIWAKAQEAAGAIASAYGKGTATTSENTTATRENSAATEQNAYKKWEATRAAEANAEANTENAQSLRALTSEMTAGGKTQAEWAAMGERMAERYKEIAKTTRDILNSSKEGTLGYIAGMRKANDYLGRAGRSAIASWEKQIKKIEAVEAALARGARVSESMLAGLDLIDKQRLDNVRSAIERTNDEAGKLDKKRLGGFRNEIRRTREDVDQLRNSLKDTASDLERELASIRGETVRAEELEQQRKMAELQAKYKEAKQAGDREAIAAAQRALSLQRQINEERMKQVKAEAAPPQQDSATPAPSQNVPGATSKSTPQGTSTQVVRLQLDLGTGEPVEGQYSEADADRLLRQLREKGAVTR